MRCGTYATKQRCIKCRHIIVLSFCNRLRSRAWALREEHQPIDPQLTGQHLFIKKLTFSVHLLHLPNYRSFNFAFEKVIISRYKKKIFREGWPGKFNSASRKSSCRTQLPLVVGHKFANLIVFFIAFIYKSFFPLLFAVPSTSDFKTSFLEQIAIKRELWE